MGKLASEYFYQKKAQAISIPGKRVMKFWIVSGVVILQKMVIDLGGVKQSYLGSPETKIE